MKQKNVSLIVSVAIVAALFSAIISSVLFSATTNRREKVPVASAINPDFPDPGNDENFKAFFNPGALDPTQLIQIGGSSNTQPFSGSQ